MIDSKPNKLFLLVLIGLLVSLTISIDIVKAKANEETIQNVEKIKENVTVVADVGEELSDKAEEEVETEVSEFEDESHWTSLGSCRITTYCAGCNDPAGSYQSSSGAMLYEGCVACNWLPIGTRLRIDGCEYVVMDTCGTDAIDIFVDTGYCMCNANYYTEVYVYE